MPPKKTADTSTTVVDEPNDPRALVDSLNAEELEFALLYRSKSHELGALRAERGDQLRAATDRAGAARDSAQRVSVLLNELEGFADASKRARELRLAAIPAVFAAEAADKERQATELEVESARLEAESIKLRKALEKHDDWGYFPAEGKVEDRYFAAVLHGAGEFRVVDARGPLFKRKLDAARALHREAAAHRLKTAHQAGGGEADTVEELFSTVHSDAMRVAPAVDAIVAWAEKAMQLEQRRRDRDGFTPANAPMRLHLEWRNGAIDTSTSRVGQSAALEQASPYLDNGAPREKPIDFALSHAVDVDPDDLEDTREPVAVSTPYDA